MSVETCGAGKGIIAASASVAASVVILFFSKVPSGRGAQLLLVNSSTYENEEKDHLDMAIEVSLKEQGQLLKRLMGLDCITSASIASHEGEVTV